MLKTKIYNLEGQNKGEIELNSQIFAVEVNPVVVQQVVEAYLANKREVLAHTKLISDVRGGGRKPWKQKGTGRARHGSSRSPLWKGGGVTFGPRKNRNFAKKVNKKMKLKALFMVLSDKLKNEKLMVLEDFNLDKRKTKDLLKIFKNVNLDDKKLVLGLDKKNINIQDSAKNIKNVKVMPVDSFNVYTLLKYENLVLTKSSIEKISKHFI